MNETMTATVQPTQERQPMEISVNIYPPRKGDPALAAASVCLNGCFVVRGIRVVVGSGGPYISMPSRQLRSGSKIVYKDTCFPCNEEFRQQFDGAILDAYRQYAAQAQTAPAAEASGPEEQAEQEATP